MKKYNLYLSGITLATTFLLTNIQASANTINISANAVATIKVVDPTNTDEALDRQNTTYMAVLNTLAYIPGFREDSLNKDVYSWAEQFTPNQEDQKHAAMIGISKSMLGDIKDGILAEPELYSNIKVLDVDEHPAPNGDKAQSVFNFALSYKDALIIMYRGTGGELEWFDNGAASGEADSEQQIAALEYFNKIYDKYGKDYSKIFLTGHSKGGNKAMYITTLLGDKVTRAYSFDGQGFSNDFITKYQTQIHQYADKMININGNGDIVNILMKPIAGTFKYLNAPANYGLLDGYFFQNPIYSGLTGNQLSPIGKLLYKRVAGLHAPTGLFTYDKDGKIILQNETTQNPLMKTVHVFLMSAQNLMTSEEYKAVAELAMRLFVKPENWHLYNWTLLSISAIPKLIETGVFALATNPQIIFDLPAVLFSLLDFTNFIS